MKNTLLFKKFWLIVSFLLLNVLVVNAKVNVTSFSLPSTYLVSDKLNIPNPTVATSFQFNISFLRALFSNGSFESVSGSSITLVYSDCNFCGNYTEISTTRNLSEADFYQGSTNWPSNNAHLTLNAELPANKATGFIMVKHVYFDTNQNKTLTEYISNTTIGVQVSNNYINPTTLSKISSMGFDTDGIISGNDYYLVEGDIMLSKAYVNSYVLNDPLPKVTYDNINILLPLSSFSSTEWYNSLAYAALAWNSSPNCNIKLHIIYGGQPFPTPDRIDITVSASTAASSVPVTSRFPSNDGKPGNQIVINTNFKYANTNSYPSRDQAARNVIQAVGHCLGLKHASGLGSENSIMQRGTSSSNWSQFSNADIELFSLTYPLISSDQVTPFISGKSPLHNYESASFDVSYQEVGTTYSWRVVGINGTIFDQTYDHYRFSRLPEESFPTGNYQLQCTMNTVKHGIVLATKNIIVN